MPGGGVEAREAGDVGVAKPLVAVTGDVVGAKVGLTITVWRITVVASQPVAPKVTSARMMKAPIIVKERFAARMVSFFRLKAPIYTGRDSQASRHVSYVGRLLFSG